MWRRRAFFPSHWLHREIGSEYPFYVSFTWKRKPNYVPLLEGEPKPDLPSHPTHCHSATCHTKVKEWRQKVENSCARIMRERPFGATKVHPHGTLFPLPFLRGKNVSRCRRKKSSGFLTAWRVSIHILATVCTAPLAFCVEKTSTKLVRHRIIRIFAANYP